MATAKGDSPLLWGDLTCLLDWAILTIVMQQIKFTSHIFKEGEAFVSFCPELGVSSCGDTLEEARRRLVEAVRLFLEESQRMGTLEDILREEGFVPTDSTGTSWSPPPLIASEHLQVAF